MMVNETVVIVMDPHGRIVKTRAGVVGRTEIDRGVMVTIGIVNATATATIVRMGADPRDRTANTRHGGGRANEVLLEIRETNDGDLTRAVCIFP